ncbi:serine/threonine protein kinase [Streptomyces asoensis]|uniref:Serine/threonine protein kinase n=1 Tax=Streptomyces asoensis TaxID=249586 RepID=A0A6M4WUY0_9ACTN|nr:serine/threonine protein kinase [Streptomyces asoensis]QJT03185.1 serine/threonine protein kinase [Streptomyces asoensis]
MTQVPLIGMGTINFEFFKIKTGSVDGARAHFEEMIQDLVGVIHPDFSTLDANPGDWGIDAYVGSLVDGDVNVWQSKYFIDDFGKSQQDQIRDAYEQALACAKREGYTLSTWTLCMPRNLDGPNEKWWTGWKKKKEKSDGVRIALWNQVQLRRLLLSEDATNIRNYYFNPTVSLPDPSYRPTVTLANFDQYEGALFVRQMEHAGMFECDDAKEEFFNAEILSHEVTDKAVTEEVEALSRSKAELGSLWAQRFNVACQANPDGPLVDLYVNVMDAVRDHHPKLPASIRSGLVHTFGMVHQRVNDGRAGWARDYRDVAREHLQSVDADKVPTNNTTSVDGENENASGEQND